jgi:hypothetical protein
MKNPFTGVNHEKSHTNSENRRVKNQWRWNLDFRLFVGVTLIVASLISAYVISKSTSKMITVWSATNDLAPGEMIEKSDVAVTRVALVNKAEFYLDGKSPIVGSYVLRPIRASELIPAFALSEMPLADLYKVPISLPSLRIPQGVSSGSVVDVYGVIRSSTSNLTSAQNLNPTKKLLTGVSVDATNMEANRLGGETGLTLLVPTDEVYGFISSFSDYEFILVKSE